MAAGEPPDKRQLFEAFLRDGWVSLYLDARRAGVRLPPALTESPQVVLQYGHGMPVPIADLTVDGDGIGATLSFARTPHATFVPWAAVYALVCTDGRGVVFERDLPEGVRLAGPPPAPATAPGPSVSRAPRKVARKRAAATAPRHLQAVPAPSGDRGGDEVGHAPAAARRTTRRRPALRLVK